MLSGSHIFCLPSHCSYTGKFFEGAVNIINFMFAKSITIWVPSLNATIVLGRPSINNPLFNSNAAKGRKPNRKMNKRLQTGTLQKRGCNNQAHRKRGSSSLIIREMKIKTTRLPHLIYNRIQKRKMKILQQGDGN